ncbi:MAG: SUMF1/EgtB/PvdO family nonheme iron enzyme [Lacipirellulaceae bacterium]
MGNEPANAKTDEAEQVSASKESTEEVAVTTAETANDQPTILGLQKTKPADGVFVESDHGYMVPYVVTIPGSDVKFEMVPIPGGTFLLGSSESEANRGDDEGPQVEIEVPPFWMAKTEVTWAEYRQFMSLYDKFKQVATLRTQLKTDKQAKKTLERTKALQELVQSTPEEVDAVTSPTPLYYPEVTYESGEDPDLPAVTMTPYAARQYTKWLSLVAGQTYRLPSEVEWEYAARAGSTSAYSFGDSAEDIGSYGWFVENSDDRSQPVGKKKANPWGLHDMHGNVAEIVLDEYAADTYEKLAKLEGATSQQAIQWPAKQFPRVVRGGSWLDDPAALRSAARFSTDDLEWKASDPNLPLSPWWYTEIFPAGGVGFRVMRPLEPLSKELQKKAWEIDAPELRLAVEARLEEGRGALETVGPKLPRALGQLEDAEVQKLLD